MPITDYGTLKGAIADWMARGDLGSAIPDFVSFATDLFNYGADQDQTPALRCREMEVIEDLVPTNGVRTLPADYLQYISVVEKSSPRRTLKFITMDAADSLYPSRTSGMALNFSIVSGSLYTFPLASNQIELTYFEKLTALSSDGDTNWLLTKNPQAYLRASLIAGYEYIKDNDGLTKAATMHKSFVSGMNRNGLLSKYARSGLTIGGVTP